MAKATYTEDNIRSLDWKEHIRLRPGMYIGKLGNGTAPDDGIYILFKEVIDNSIDEYMMGAGKKIEIILVSSDENINVFEDHFSKMPWLAVRYTERDSRRQLSEIFKVSSVPTFVWVDVKSGEQLAVDGLETVTVGCEYFPWGDEQIVAGRQDAITNSHSSTRLETHDLWKQNSQIILRDCRHHAEIEQDYTIFFNEFATVIGEVQLQVGGKYYYEIEVVDIDYCPGAQLGWSSEGFKVSCLLIFFTFVQHTLFVSLLD